MRETKERKSNNNISTVVVILIIVIMRERKSVRERESMKEEWHVRLLLVTDCYWSMKDDDE